MAKNSKPYNNVNRNRTLPNHPKKNKNDGKEKTKNLENTIKIRIDKDRLLDSNTLDTSFLEGRVQGKNNPKKTEKDKNKSKQYKVLKANQLRSLKFVFFSLSFLCILVLISLIAFNKTSMDSTINSDNDLVHDKVIDDNYLFIGDYHTVGLDLEEYQFSYPYVKVTDENMTTDMILNDLEKKVYIYNPSVVFIEVGINDLIEGGRIIDSITNYKNIIKEIRNNRPNAHIYVESLYPIDFDKINRESPYHYLNQATMKQYNQELKNVCNSLDAEFVDIYKALSEDNQLKDHYTSDGIHLNHSGQKKVWKILKKIVDDEG